VMLKQAEPVLVTQQVMPAAELATAAQAKAHKIQ